VYARDEDIYFKIEITTPGYDIYYLMHLSIAVGEINLEPIEYDDSARGHVRYHIAVPFATGESSLVITTKLNGYERRMLVNKEDVDMDNYWLEK